jgi:archaellum component FlaC
VVSDEAEPLTPEMRQFVKMIDMKQEELKKLAIEQPALYQQFTNDLNQLDSSYAELKKQLNTVTNKELLLEAMIQNLQLQLSVLNQQLNIIHQIKEKSKSHEKNTQAI